MRFRTVKGAKFDVEFERFKLFLLLIAIVTLIVSGYYTLHEVRYLLFGKFVTAKVANVRETTDSSHRRPKRRLRADYEIATVAGAVQHEHEQLPVKYSLMIGQDVRLQLIPDIPGSARLPRPEYTVGPLIFTGMMLVVIIGLGRLVYEANTRGYSD